MSGNSNVGNSQVYEAGDQRTSKNGEDAPIRFHEGKENAHDRLDSKDQRSIANKLAHEEQREHEESSPKSLEQQRLEEDATLPAKAHGNKPSRGAEIDQEIREEEEAILKKKGAWGPQK